MISKATTLTEAIERFVRDGDTVFLGGFVAGEPNIKVSRYLVEGGDVNSERQ